MSEMNRPGEEGARSSIGKNTAVGLATNVVTFTLGILVSIVLTRSLGADGRGIYALLVATNVLLTYASGLSIELAFSTFLARGRYTLGTASTIALLLAVTLGLVGLLVVTALYPFLSDNVFLNVPYAYIVIALLLTIFTIYLSYWNAMMVGLNRVIAVSKYNLAASVGNTLFMVLMVGVLQLGIPGFLVAWATSTVVGGIVALAWSARMQRPAWPPERRALREMVGFGLRLHGMAIAHHFFLRFDMFALNALAGTARVGYYSVATSLAEKLWVPLDVINQSSLAKVAQLPRDESALLAAKLARTAILMMLSMALPIAAVSPWLIPFMYGRDFSEAVPPFVILLLGILGFAVMLVLNSYILGQMERPGLLSIVAWLQLGVSIPLYITLILWLGVVGAAIASALTYILAGACTTYIFVRDSGLRVSQVLLPRASDFHDYGRVIARGWNRLRVLRGR
ncbi:MAG TPA: oligosaccharide flippase family protein [Chloroflexia bacterium]|nr:oligosaccharide flippase family protein [Chloroflexia bacterium]